MPRNEQGEYELVLGTPQLLSLLFIIVVLFGVVFSLGYFMGRSTAPGPAGPVAQGTAAGGAEEKTGPRPGPAGQALPPAPPESAGAAEPGSGQVAGTTPVGGAPAPAATPATPEAKPPAPSSAETPPTGAPPSPAAGQTPASSAPSGEPAAKSYPEPAPGQTFLQVAAVPKNEAEFAADSLKRKGFAALVAPGPNERLFRVLVGPLKDAEEIAKTRKALEEAGFRSAYVRKY